MARRNGLTPQQLFGWRHQAQVLNGRGAGALEGPSLPGPSTLASQLRPKRGLPRLDRSTGQPTVPCAGQAPAPVFAPVVIGAPPASAPPAPVATTLPGTIEIVVGDAVVRIGGQVDAQHIAAVLRAVRRSS